MSGESFVEATKLNLTETELDVIEKYTGGESLWINNYLRNRDLEDVNETNLKKLKRYSTILNDIMKHKSPPSRSATKVYRGAEAMHQSWRKLKTGEELMFTNKGIISTSFNKKAALSFIEEDDDCCLLVLTLPKGTKGLYISSQSVFSDLEEDELLLPHGSKFVVTKKTFSKYENKKILTYHADLVSQNATISR
jgi:hypothetical protein